MDEHINENDRPVNPRRRRRTQMEIFKEAYLPTIIAGVALLLILIFIIGSISRAVQKNKAEKEASIEASIALEQEEAQLTAQVQKLLTDAQKLAEGYDYEGAVALLNTFTGDTTRFTAIPEKIGEYTAAQAALVAWDDPSKIVNLSFHLLMADPERAIAHEEYGFAFNRNYVTVNECANILQQLYDNGYVLVDFDDIVTTEVDADGNSVMKANTLYLPDGKKPIMLTQTNVNYNIYMVDGDGDKLPDKDGAGFASRLVLDASGNITCEMVDSSGQTVTGAYDLVPILESFIAQHPDFSYKGARATLALTGYNGLFGHRTYKGADTDFGADTYNSAVTEATAVAKALRDKGYRFACYTYENVAYGDYGAAMIETDLNKWIEEALPILGSVDVMAFAQQSDIAEPGVYSGDKFEVLKNAGFKYYLGFASGAANWTSVGADHFRMGRILVSGNTMAHNAALFEGIFDPAQALETAVRGEIPG